MYAACERWQFPNEIETPIFVINSYMCKLGLSPHQAFLLSPTQLWYSGIFQGDWEHSRKCCRSFLLNNNIVCFKFERILQYILLYIFLTEFNNYVGNSIRTTGRNDDIFIYSYPNLHSERSFQWNCVRSKTKSWFYVSWCKKMQTSMHSSSL